MKKIISQIKSSHFARSVGVLAGGTVFAQALMVIILPILSRFYSPSDFGLLAVYSAYLGMFSVVACLRLDIAIPVPENEEDAIGLLVLSLLSSVGIGLIIGCLVYLLPDYLLLTLGLANLKAYLWLLPIGISSTGALSALQFWALRKKKFSLISKTKITQSVTAASSQIGFGLIGGSAFGLLLGQMLVGGSGALSLGGRIWADSKVMLTDVTLSKLLATLNKYRRYPQYSTIEALSNSAAIQLPIIMISTALIGAEAGFLMLAMRVMQAPMSLLGSAISQVYVAHASDRKRNGELANFTRSTLSGLIKVGVGPIIFAGIVSPYVFGLIFGSAWARSGEIVAWMTPWIVFQFLSSPISMALHVLNKQFLVLLFQVFGLLLRITFVWIGLRISEGYVSEFYAISGAIFYFLYLFLILYYAKCGFRAVISASVDGLPFIIVWIILALLFVFVFDFM